MLVKVRDRGFLMTGPSYSYISFSALISGLWRATSIASPSRQLHQHQKSPSPLFPLTYPNEVARSVIVSLPYPPILAFFARRNLGTKSGDRRNVHHILPRQNLTVPPLRSGWLVLVVSSLGKVRPRRAPTNHWIAPTVTGASRTVE